MIIRLTAVLALLSKVVLGGDTRYECGPHGRFEYCIDGIPGCVIGCHCHPGYYFDSDAKICEPNTKLTLDTRRNIALTPNNGPPATTTPKIGFKDEDLGDWLYNQFFKTIENEVVNKTSADPLTRRSGSKKAKRSKKKKRKSKRRNKKGKVKLRMDENDSVFKSGDGSGDSNSDSSGSSDSGSSDSDDSSSDSSSSSDSRSRGTDRPQRRKDHKHFMMINRNRPPLPSFVFLPNMHTPYFPPFGLPPPLPAPAPMFPVLPVPPLMPFPPCKDDDNITPQNNTTTVKTVTENEDNKNVTIVATDATKNSKESKTSQESMTTESGGKPNVPNSNEITGRKKLLRERMRRLKRKRLKSMATRKYTNTHIYPGLNPMRSQNKQVFDNVDHTANNVFNKNNIPEDSYMDNETYSYDDYDDAGYQPEKDTNVNFKYLSDLIHKSKGTTNIKNIPNALPQKLSVFEDPPSQPVMNTMQRLVQSAAAPPRDHYGEINHRMIRPPDESYYSNLGKEIAALIRKLDTKGERQVNIEIEQIPKQAPAFNDNTFGAISNWERRARSPTKSERLPHRYYISSEEMLFRLEDMANGVATTTPTLDLAQIEEAIRFMQLTEHRNKPQHHHKTQPSKNVNIANTKLNKNKFVDKTLPKNLMLPAENRIKNKAKFKNNIYQAKRPLLEFFDHFPNRDQIDSYVKRPILNNAQKAFNFISEKHKNETLNTTDSENRKSLLEIEGWNQNQKPMQRINFEAFIPFGNQLKYKKGSSLSQFAQERKLPIMNNKSPSYFHQFDDFF